MIHNSLIDQTQPPGIEFDSDVRRAGKRAWDNRMKLALQEPDIADCVDHFFNECEPSDGEPDYESQNFAVGQVNTRAATLKGKFGRKEKFDFWDGDFNEGFGNLAHLGLVECHPHFNQYRIRPKEEFREYVTIYTDFSTYEAPIAPPKDEFEYVHFKAIRDGLNMLSLSEPDQFEKYEDRVMGCYIEQKPIEVDIAVALERNLNIWMPDLTLTREFKSTDTATYELELSVAEIDGQAIHERSESDIINLFESLDSLVITQLAMVSQPLFSENEIRCDCTARQHIAFTANPDYNTGTYSQAVTPEELLKGDFEDHELKCKTAVSDEFDRIKKKWPTETTPLRTKHRLRFTAVDHSPPGGR